MKHSIDYNALDARARALMEKREAHGIWRERGSIYFHGARTAAGVVALRKRIFPDDASRDDALKIAAMFHDIGKGIEPHERYGAALFREAVADLLLPDMIGICASMIASHCDRRPNEAVYDPWARLLQDADVLDHFGSYQVWMDVYYASADQSPPRTLIEGFYAGEYDKLKMDLRALLNYPESIKIFDEKTAFSDAWIERFKIEMNGGYIV